MTNCLRTLVSNSFSTDEEIVDRVLGGDVSLFELILRRYNQRLYRISKGMGIPDADSDDIIQQSYINAYENLAKFRRESKFSTWLTRIVINQCLMFKRKTKTWAVDKEINDSMLTESQHLDAGESPEFNLLNNEMKAALEMAINSLPDAYRTIYIMREIEEISVKECAECLGLTESNIKVRLHRAKAMLKEHLEKQLKSSELFEFGNARCDSIVRTFFTWIEDRKASLN